MFVAKAGVNRYLESRKPREVVVEHKFTPPTKLTPPPRAHYYRARSGSVVSTDWEDSSSDSDSNSDAMHFPSPAKGRLETGVNQDFQMASSSFPQPSKPELRCAASLGVKPPKPSLKRESVCSMSGILSVSVAPVSHPHPPAPPPSTSSQSSPNTRGRHLEEEPNSVPSSTTGPSSKRAKNRRKNAARKRGRKSAEITQQPSPPRGSGSTLQ
jgi:hypothetical protein